MICERCGKRYRRADSKEAYYDFFDGEGDFDWDFKGESLCPDCTLDDCNEMASNNISDSDYEDYLMSIGEYEVDEE